MRVYFIVISLILILSGTYLSIIDIHWVWSFAFILPFILLGLYDSLQRSNNVWRNFPWVGHVKAVFVNNRELAQDWFLENDREGRPFNWVQREIIYKRADNVSQETPFGTQFNYYKPSFEWLLHSAAPLQH